ncbi:MAG: Uma2 family endonuclease [Chitinophagaceae bacterium]|jgi:Uma2 family endonuclease|nr:MAG: Uma2 family endonuclease [Chitinophagaceae bacterium]
MSVSVKILPNYTYDDYVHWEGQWEVIDGVPYAMSPAAVPKHQRIAVSISSAFNFQLKECKKCTVYQPIDYVTEDNTILQPDMLIVCEEITKKYLDFPPTLVLEILSPATALKDRHTKYDIYESQGIKYYLIIDPEAEQIEIYEVNMKTKKYELKGHGDSFRYKFLLENCQALIDFSEIW